MNSEDSTNCPDPHGPGHPPVALTFDDVLLVPRGTRTSCRPTANVDDDPSAAMRLRVPRGQRCHGHRHRGTSSRSRSRSSAASGSFTGTSRSRSRRLRSAKVKRSESGMVVDPVTSRRTPPNLRRPRADGAPRHLGAAGHRGSSREGRLVGILTSRDLRFETRVRPPGSTKLMTRAPLHTAPLGTTLEEAKAILHEHRVEKLPVLDETTAHSPDSHGQGHPEGMSKYPERDQGFGWAAALRRRRGGRRCRDSSAPTAAR